MEDKDFEIYLDGVIDRAKNNVGYVEAESKESFVTGIRVASKYFRQTIENFESTAASEKNWSTVVAEDIKTLGNLIKKYTEMEI